MAALGMSLLVLCMLVLPPSFASATTDAPDLLRIDVNFQWTNIPFLATPLTVSGSNVWQPTVGYVDAAGQLTSCLLYTSPSPRDRQKSRMPSSA